MLWREHTVYRERSGGMVIRGEHVERWISLAPAGGAGEVLVRAGRILDGGTTAPARSEAVVPLSAGMGPLAATCRRLLAEAAADAIRVPPGRAESGRSDRPRRTQRLRRSRRSRRAERRNGRGRHTGFSSWVIMACVVGVVALYVYSAYGTVRHY
ncbi:hypothetical protein [Streptomyces sp. SID14515]|uniref:hypothetical protein n=1 Tax=Streptomyces sp. SID14515 TaxID=2706074 RepID=UPI0013CAE31B|nr:hypothetical protein [Streptomyces sp. SID14515]NEB37936.1 hypothetical protein [Streptomyces sp. SID14515]